MPGESSHYHCTACGTRVVMKQKWRQNPSCQKCGLQLQEGDPPKAGRLGLILILSGLGVVVCIATYLVLK